MKKIIIPNGLVNAVAYDEIIKNHERKARRKIRKQRMNELISQGIAKEIAKVMVDIELNPIY